MASAFPDRMGGAELRQVAKHHVMVVVFALHEWRGWSVEALEIIDTRERQRVERQRQPRHRVDLALAYALHRMVLARALDIPPARVPLARDPRGRPTLDAMEAQTSLSHADGYVAVALSQSGAIGVDVEPTSRAQVMPEVADRICHGDEFARIAACRGADRGAALLDLWVRKEAFLKAAGVGLAREMDTFSLPVDRAVALHPGQAGRVEIERLDLGPDVACAVARPPGVGCIAGWLRPTRQEEAR